jgi:hypothetical protein
MPRRRGPRDPVRAWTALPGAIRRAIAGLSQRQLDVPVVEGQVSIRMYVHHLVEANLIAANLVLAALGSPGTRYDWSWVWPDGAWMKRLGYHELPIGPALALFDALAAHLAAVVRRSPTALRQAVRLLDAPGSSLRRRTVAQLLADECEHAGAHLDEIAAAKRNARRAPVRRRPKVTRAPFATSP